MGGFAREGGGVGAAWWDIVERVNPCAGLARVPATDAECASAGVTGAAAWLGCHQNSTPGSVCHFSWPKKRHRHHQSDQELRDTAEPLMSLHSSVSS